MRNFKTYADENNIYSVDMMMAYVNQDHPDVIKVPLTEIDWQLDQQVWGTYSPRQVMEKPHTKKYAENRESIRKADLSFPIFMTSQHKIIDGYHRLIKATETKQDSIKAYIFSPTLMRKFIINKNKDFVQVHQNMEIYELLELYRKRFEKT